MRHFIFVLAIAAVTALSAPAWAESAADPGADSGADSGAKAATEPATDSATDSATDPGAKPGVEAFAAPFGLKWGMNVSDLTAAGIAIQSTTRSGSLTVVNVKETPETLQGTYIVNLLFDRDHGLVKVRWTGTNIENDPTGKVGRVKYEEIRDYVTKRYGKPTDEAQVVGARLFDQKNEFYQCLAYEGCGAWSALWEHAPSGGVLLSIEGLGPGKGFVQVDFESANWKTAIAGLK